MAKMFEVKVEVISHDYYEVSARDEDDAREKFMDGVLSGTAQLHTHVESVTEMFPDDEWDNGEYRDDD